MHFISTHNWAEPSGKPCSVGSCCVFVCILQKQNLWQLKITVLQFPSFLSVKDSNLHVHHTPTPHLQWENSHLRWLPCSSARYLRLPTASGQRRPTTPRVWLQAPRVGHRKCRNGSLCVCFSVNEAETPACHHCYSSHSSWQTAISKKAPAT